MTLTGADRPAWLRLRRIAALVSLVAVTMAAGWWAGRATLAPTATGDAAAAPTVTVGVVEATVGRSIRVGVTLRQPSEPAATNTLAGMVTWVHPGGPHQVGETLFVVAGLPVRVVEGGVPFHRDLGLGVSGDDVRQLQVALRALGYLDAEPDGTFGPVTARAVSSWQDDLGLRRTGTVTLGEVLAVPELPAALIVGSQIRRGALVGGGEPAVSARTGEQDFALVLSSDQAAQITSRVPIWVAFEDLSWEARVREATVDEAGNTVMSLGGESGGPVCGQDCARLPTDEVVSLLADAVIVPEVTGPAVPVAAVRTSTAGAAYVVLSDGTERDVTVRGSGQGLAVVDGLAVGDVVVVPSDADGG